MERRAFLIGTGSTVALAGCVGDTEDPEGSGDSDTAEEDEQSTEETENDTVTEAETDTETQEAAKITYNELQISPSTPLPGQRIKISSVVENTGKVSGIETVEFRVAGELLKSQQIELEPGEMKKVEAMTKSNKIDDFRITVGDLEKTLTIIGPEIKIESSELVRVSEDTGYVETKIINHGDGISGRVYLTVKWLNSSGTYIGEDDLILESLGQNERWLARISPLTTDLDEIADYQIIGEYEKSRGYPTEKIKTTNSNFDINNMKLVVEANNSHTESLEYVSTIGKVYNKQGYVIAGKKEVETDISEGKNISSQINFSSELRLFDKDNISECNIVFKIGSTSADRVSMK